MAKITVAVSRDDVKRLVEAGLRAQLEESGIEVVSVEVQTASASGADVAVEMRARVLASVEDLPPVWVDPEKVKVEEIEIPSDTDAAIAAHVRDLGPSGLDEIRTREVYARMRAVARQAIHDSMVGHVEAGVLPAFEVARSDLMRFLSKLRESFEILDGDGEEIDSREFIYHFLLAGGAVVDDR